MELKSGMQKLKQIFLIFIYLIILKLKPITAKPTTSNVLIFTNTSWTDRRPQFAVNMTFNQDGGGGVSTLTWIENDIDKPVAKLKILQREINNKISTLYSVTARLCELKQFFDKIPMFKSSFHAATKQGNYTFSCPLKRGFYVMENIHLPNRHPALEFMFRTKTSFTFIGGLYEELANKSLLPLTTYEFTTKVVKKSFKEK